MAKHVQIGLKCPKCRSRIVFGYDSDVEDSVPCISCGHTINKDEVIKQAKPQLVAIAEKEMLKAFKKVPGFKPGQK